jgi:hypothetical protein
MGKLLEDIAKGASIGIDALHAIKAVSEYYQAEKYRADGDKKGFNMHKKEFRKYYGLILNREIKKHVREIAGSYLPNK